jgi:outer membrane receptor protein involved in Fe transport
MWFDSTSGTRRYFPRIHTNPDYDPDRGVGRLLQPFRTHTYLSPRAQVAFPVTDRLNMRFSYAHQVQPPDFYLMLRRQNTDWEEFEGVYGGDLDFSKTILFEFGTRYAFDQDMVLDVSVFNRDDLSRPTGRSRVLYDPVQKRDATVQLLTTADFGNVRGLDIRLDRRIGTWLNGFLGYTYQAATNTGSDPLSYLDRASQLLGSLTGVAISPPQAAITTRDSRPHNLTGALSLTVPPGWKAGSFAGAVLAEVGAFATFRFASGTAYTACPATVSNDGILSTAGGCAYNTSFGAINGARLPALKEFDLRLTKGFRMGPTNLTAYFEARNLFNFTNTTRVFASTGSTRSDGDRGRWWAADSLDWATNAAANGVLTPDGGMDLSFAGAGMAGCASWRNNAAAPAAPDCVYLTRAEQRWGDGDGIFELDEQRRSSTAYYDVSRGGAYLFSAAPRRLRLGLEIGF